VGPDRHHVGAFGAQQLGDQHGGHLSLGDRGLPAGRPLLTASPPIRGGCAGWVGCAPRRDPPVLGGGSRPLLQSPEERPAYTSWSASGHAASARYLSEMGPCSSSNSRFSSVSSSRSRRSATASQP